MRIHQLLCPACKVSISSKGGVEEGAAVACPKCKNKFKVVAAKEAEEDDVIEEFEVVEDEEESPKRPAKPAARSASGAGDDDEDDSPKAKGRSRRDAGADESDTPSSKRKSKVVEDDEDRPRRRKPRDDDEDNDDDRPRRKKRRGDDDKSPGAFGKMKGNVWVRISVLAVLLGTLGGLGYFLYLKLEKDRQTEAENAKIQQEIDQEEAFKRKMQESIKTTPPGNSTGPKKAK